jgi:hypothetical protein
MRRLSLKNIIDWRKYFDGTCRGPRTNFVLNLLHKSKYLLIDFSDFRLVKWCSHLRHTLALCVTKQRGRTPYDSLILDHILVRFCQLLMVTGWAWVLVQPSSWKISHNLFERRPLRAQLQELALGCVRSRGAHCWPPTGLRL